MSLAYRQEDYRKELQLHGRELDMNLKKRQALQAECKQLETHHAHLAHQHQQMQQQAHQSASQLSALQEQVASAELHLRALE
jgi:septal ring factor EnvC (AmiA/AmiB activator)